MDGRIQDLAFGGEVGLTPSRSSRTGRWCDPGGVGQCDPQEGRIALFHLPISSSGRTTDPAAQRIQGKRQGYPHASRAPPPFFAGSPTPRILPGAGDAAHAAERRANTGGNAASHRHGDSRLVDGVPGPLYDPRVRRPTSDGGAEPADSRPQAGTWGRGPASAARPTLARELNDSMGRGRGRVFLFQSRPERPRTFSCKEGRPWQKR